MTASPIPLGTAAWKTFRAQCAFVVHLPATPAWTRRRRIGGLGVAIAAAVATGIVGLAALPWPEQARTPPAAAAPAPAPVLWVEVTHPFTTYDLAGGPYAKLPLHYAARRNPATEAREDVLTYGAAQPGQSFLRLAFLRRGTDDPPAASVFLGAARLAAGAGLAVTRSGLGTSLDTRFGPVEVAEVTVERGGLGAGCLAFRLADPAAAPVLAVTGLACGTAEHPADLAALACTVDRLDLVSAGDDEALRAVFVTAERRRRDGCAAHTSVPPRLGAADDRAGSDGELRGRL